MTDIAHPTRLQETARMLTVECPLCDAPASYAEDAEVLDCPVCAAHLELADERAGTILAAAA